MDNINQIKFGNPINDSSSIEIIHNDIIIVRNDNTQFKNIWCVSITTFEISYNMFVQVLDVELI